MGFKSRTGHKKKRKGKVFSGFSKHEKRPSEAQTPPSVESSGSESELEINASRRKMELRGYNSDEDICAPDTNLEQGYRLVDLKSFSSSISNVHKCNEGEWICRY